MNNFKVIELNSPEWDHYIQSSFLYDFHHTSCFSEIESNGEDVPLLFMAENQNEFVALPLIIRKISNTRYFDATSVYGYGGPVFSKPVIEMSKNILVFFRENFIDFCIENNIISIFSRLHPLIVYDSFFENFGKVIDVNKTISIDLTKSLEEQRKDYRKSNKSEINQLKKNKGYTIKSIEKMDIDGLDDFVRIYHETMERVNASNYYFFDLNYFKKLLNNKCFNCNLLVAMKDNKMTAGAIFTETKTIMQYHLAGTKNEYIKDTPMKLIIDEARQLGAEKRLWHLHLGGGVGGRDDDSLFNFKSGFSKNMFQFSVWNYIINQKVYDALVKNNNLKLSNVSNYFPLYRAS